jgi:serine/threonine-protein kinase
MGIVYVGEQQMGSTIRKVAVKTLHPHLSKDSNVLKRFHRECGTVAQLEHPNTIKVYDFGSTPDGTLYIAMEFVAGRPLSDVLQTEGKLSPERVIQIMRQICGALDEAHQMGVVHRDLKPDNIILTQRAGEQDFVKVLDFGIAARTESADAAHEQKLTQQGTVLGTPPYMSPEQFTGKSLDRRSDVYSLGVMVYEMLTGKLPFEAETPWQWATQHMTAQPTPFEVAAPQLHIAEGMRQAILRSLSKEREQRQAGAGQFFAELSAGAKAIPEATPPIAAAGALPYQATAAMPEMPNFAGASPMSPVAPAVAAQGRAGAPVASTVANAAVAPAVSAPMMAAPRNKGGRKTGLVVGLSGAGLAIVAIMVVVLVRSNKPTDDPSVTSPITSSSSVSGAPATLTPEIPQDTGRQVAVQTPPQPDPIVPRENNQRKTSSKAATATHTSTATTAATPPASSPPAANPPVTPNPTPNPQPAAQNNAACDTCASLASNGDFSGVARTLPGCTDPAGKTRCVNAGRVGAIRSAQSAMRSGDCAKVRAIKVAAESVGAGSPALTNAASKCQ